MVPCMASGATECMTLDCTHTYIASGCASVYVRVEDQTECKRPPKNERIMWYKKSTRLSAASVAELIKLVWHFLNDL